LEEAEGVVGPLKEFGPPEVDLIQPMPYTEVQSLLDPSQPPGRRNYWKAENMNELTDEAIDAVGDRAAEISSPFSFVVIEPKGRAISRVGEDETAIGGRDAAHTLYAFSMWENPAEDEANIAWTRRFMQAMEPFIVPGVSPNFTSDQGQDKVEDFFRRNGKYERLVALKNEYDPTNMFRLNQNIKPARSRAAS
jgi:FAD/FMN-containing dehydrogenase